jgi:hypothetical protein
MNLKLGCRSGGLGPVRGLVASCKPGVIILFLNPFFPSQCVLMFICVAAAVKDSALNSVPSECRRAIEKKVCIGR